MQQKTWQMSAPHLKLKSDNILIPGRFCQGKCRGEAWYEIIISREMSLGVMGSRWSICDVGTMTEYLSSITYLDEDLTKIG